MSHQRRREKSKTGSITLDCLPDDLLFQIIKPLDLQDKTGLQHVSKKLYDLLLRPPPGSGLWGELYLSGENITRHATGPWGGRPFFEAWDEERDEGFMHPRV